MAHFGSTSPARASVIRPRIRHSCSAAETVNISRDRKTPHRVRTWTAFWVACWSKLSHFYNTCTAWLYLPWTCQISSPSLTANALQIRLVYHTLMSSFVWLTLYMYNEVTCIRVQKQYSRLEFRTTNFDDSTVFNRCCAQYCCLVVGISVTSPLPPTRYCWAFRTRRKMNCFLKIDCNRQLSPLKITENFAFSLS